MSPGSVKALTIDCSRHGHPSVSARFLPIPAPPFAPAKAATDQLDAPSYTTGTPANADGGGLITTGAPTFSQGQNEADVRYVIVMRGATNGSDSLPMADRFGSPKA